LELIDRLGPDLVVMDINLPGMSGVEATKAATSAHPSLVVILVSTYDADALPVGASTCGAIAYVHKEHLDADLIEQLWDERDTSLWRTA
jgi:DNA-binding NarL/FixJ family response regulator